ncbi:MAG: MarR family transcriptional regulator [Deltaproteobacteria bacterium]|nr:MarR family transcriptional regulator [Deltaproteobacteria bacterium]
MTILDRITAYLKENPEGVDDDELTQVLGLKRRQQANSRCRQLAKQGLIERRRVDGKIRNFWLGGSGTSPSPAKGRAQKEETEPWYSERNVQAAIVKHLAIEGWAIRSVADTAKREHGKDIVAERGRTLLWVTVKGYPKGTPKTPPTTQAGHWYKQAIFDIIEYRGENKTLQLGVGLPDFPKYRSLAEKITWFQPLARFTYYWVKETGEISPYAPPAC